MRRPSGNRPPSASIKTIGMSDSVAVGMGTAGLGHLLPQAAIQTHALCKPSLAVVNKGKPFQMRGAISAIAVRPPNWRGQEAYPFIITDNLRTHARGLPQCANSPISP
jgi:hypothetical protein